MEEETALLLLLLLLCEYRCSITVARAGRVEVR